eukprot:COSAG01_NODE_992_length_12250_cov_14.174356_6_plen_157_part_00
MRSVLTRDHGKTVVIASINTQHIRSSSKVGGKWQKIPKKCKLYYALDTCFKRCQKELAKLPIFQKVLGAVHGYENRLGKFVNRQKLVGNATTLLSRAKHLMYRPRLCLKHVHLSAHGGMTLFQMSSRTLNTQAGHLKIKCWSQRGSTRKRSVKGVR